MRVKTKKIERPNLVRGFGARLRAERERSGLNQSELARAVGVAPQFVSMIESERRGVLLSMVYRLARALGIDPKKLLPDAESSEKS